MARYVVVRRSERRVEQTPMEHFLTVEDAAGYMLRRGLGYSPWDSQLPNPVPGYGEWDVQAVQGDRARPLHAHERRKLDQLLG